MSKRTRQWSLIAIYLASIILANLIVAKYGAKSVLLVGFVLVGLDLTSRDYLHEAWHGRQLWLKMAALIATGSVLSWLLNKDAGAVAIASFVAFMSAAIIDTLTYHWLGRKAFLLRVNGSNVGASFADSAIFLTIAFGAFMPALILAQWGVKVAGGFVWSLLLRRYHRLHNESILRPNEP